MATGDSLQKVNAATIAAVSLIAAVGRSDA